MRRRRSRRWRAVEHEQGLPAEDRADYRSLPFTSVHLVGIGGEDVLDGVGIAEHHDGWLPRRSACEAVAELPRAFFEGLIRAPRIAQHLEERPRRGTRGQAVRLLSSASGRGTIPPSPSVRRASRCWSDSCGMRSTPSKRPASIARHTDSAVRLRRHEAKPRPQTSSGCRPFVDAPYAAGGGRSVTTKCLSNVPRVSACTVSGGRPGGDRRCTTDQLRRRGRTPLPRPIAY